jgi:hypothetical protein
VFATALLAIGFFVWKYYIGANKVKFINTDAVMVSSSFNSKFERFPSNIHHHHHHQHHHHKNPHSAYAHESVPYLPLSNDETFVEQQIDENTIQV